MDVRRELGVKYRKTFFEVNQFAGGEAARLPEFAPELQDLFFRIFVADVVDDFVEKFVVFERQVAKCQRLGSFEVNIIPMYLRVL